MRDVAHVRDGYAAADQHRARRRAARVAPDDPEVRAAPRRSTSSPGPRRAADSIAERLPPELQGHAADRPVALRARLDRRRRARKRSIAACLTGLMILIFLGSWRSTVIIAVSIPLSILCSLLDALGARRDDQHHDARRARARGRHPRRRRHGRDREHQPQPRGGQGDRDRRSSTARRRSRCRPSSRRSAICIVFVPMFFLTGVARYLFVPLAEAVVFAMLASYFLSRTLVPTMAKFLLQAASPCTTSRQPAFFSRFQRGVRGAVRAVPRGYRRPARRRPAPPQRLHARASSASASCRSRC